MKAVALEQHMNGLHGQGARISCGADQSLCAQNGFAMHRQKLGQPVFQRGLVHVSIVTQAEGCDADRSVIM